VTVQRAFPTFAIVFAAVYSVIYVLAVFYNWALFTYGPATGEFGPLVTPASAGPTMYWYGWMATAALSGAVVAAGAAVLPEAATRQIPAALSWVVPIVVIVVFGFLLRGYFLR
jgi:hypothetical protein